MNFTMMILTWGDILEQYERVAEYWEDPDEFEDYYISYLRETRGDRIEYTNAFENLVCYDPVDNFPVGRRYEVWCEGFKIGADRGMAFKVGEVNARNFRQAATALFCSGYVQHVNEQFKPNTDVTDWDHGYLYFDPINLTFKGRALTWSEKLARTTYG